MKYIYRVLGVLLLFTVYSYSYGQGYNSGYPNVNIISSSEVIISTSINNTGGNTYYTKFVILPSSEPTPTRVQVFNGQDSYNQFVPSEHSKTITVTSADTEFSENATSLISNTDYVAYIISYYMNGFTPTLIESTEPPTSVAFNIPAYPASYSTGYPSSNNITNSEATILTNLTNTNEETYTTRFVVLPATETAPTREQVYNGQDGNNQPVPNERFKSITVPLADTDFFETVTNLTSNTNYVAYIVSFYINGFVPELIEEANPTEVTFTTSAPLEITNYNPEQDAINVAINQNPQLTFNQDIQFSTITIPYYIRIAEQLTGNTVQYFILEPGIIDPLLDISNNQLTITLRSDLDINTEYYITIPDGVIESVQGAPFPGIDNDLNNNWRFTTTGEPVWATGYPFTENITHTIVDIVGQTDKDGTYIYVVTPSVTAPSVAQIKNGVDELGQPALYTNSGTPGTMTGGTDFRNTLDISGLDTETTYYVYIVATDNAYSLDSQVGITSFTTLERTPPITSFDPAGGSNDVSIMTDIIVTFDEPVRMLNGTVIDNTNVGSLISFTFDLNPVPFTATINTAKTIITITPNDPLVDNTSYDVTIATVEDTLGNEQTTSSTTSFSTANYITWNGSTSSDWEVDQNWDGSFIQGISVHIPSNADNMPVISSAIITGNVLIDAEASLEITGTGSLTINNRLTLGSSNTGFGNASLINNGTLTITPENVTIHQSISSGDNIYYISSPVSGATKANIGCDNAMYSYSNPTDSWVLTGDNATMNIGNGYALKSSTNLTFSGAINDNSNYMISLTRTAEQGLGWNLVGNPYPAAINWDNIPLNLKVNLVDAIWIYLNDQGIYGSYSPIGGGTNLSDGEIPSNQAFWVKVLEGDYTSGSLTIPKSALQRNSKSILKSGTAVAYPKIKLAGVNGDYIDETAIAFSDLSENTEDIYDADKKFSNNTNYLQLFTFENSQAYAINCKNTLNDDLSIPVGFKAPAKGTFSIKNVNETGISDSYNIFLEDKLKDGFLINLTDQKEYTFTTEQSGTISDRFAIHFIKQETTNINKPDNKENIIIYSNDNTIFINGNNLFNKQYKIYTVEGNIIKQGKLRKDGLNTISLNKKGLFIVQIINSSSLVSKKVLLD